MIGIDRKTGRTIDGWDQFVSRATQALTTQLGDREHRRTFGSRVPELLARNVSDNLLIMAQTYAVEAFYNAENGIGDFAVETCVATRTDTGLSLRFTGIWQHQRKQFEVST